MKCTNCGSDVAADLKFCGRCGAAVPLPPIPVTVLLSPEDARQGCQKVLRLEGMVQPVMLRLQSGIADGQQLRVKQVRFQNGQEQDLLLTVRVQTLETKKKRRRFPTGLVASILVVAMLVGGVVLFREPLGKLFQSVADPGDTAQPSINAEELIPYFRQRVLLQQLSEEDLQTFCQLYQAAKEARQTIAITTDLPSPSLDLLLRLLEVECPELFHVDFSKETSFTVNLQTDLVQSVTLNYRMDPSQYEALYQQCSKTVSRLAKEAEGLEPEEKLKFVFDHLSLNCHYDKETDLSGTACGALVEKRAKCDGIGLACKWLLEEMGMESICVVADIPGSPVGHAWNKVNLGGIYYNVDVTQSVRQEELPEPLQEQVLYVAYQVSDAHMDQFYDVLDFYEQVGGLPQCRTMADSYYARQDALVSTGDDPDALVVQVLDRAQAAGDAFAVIQFENASDCQRFMDRAGDVLNGYLNTLSQPTTISYWVFAESTLALCFSE